MPSSDPLPVDTGRPRSVLFGRPEPTDHAHLSTVPDDRMRVAVGPGRTAPLTSTSGPRPLPDDVNGYPVQIAKVQPPALRAETLARERLLAWLGVKIHDRVVLIIAEAGYGKTTLLADFSRRTRARTLWYRLDDADRGWIPFLSHLVAAGREHDPNFAPATSDLLREVGATEPPRQVVLETFLRELPTIATGGAALILDDFHVVDDAEDVRDIVRALVLRAPERMSIVISSRRQPGLPIARLRAQGEVAELSTDDLRFDRIETERLFRDAYAQPLEPDVLSDLSERTEGWAASLQLVNAALRGRSAAGVRSFVHTLSGAEGDLYDYLAEEVVGDLRPEMQTFLMRLSILETVEPALAALVAGVDLATTRHLMDESAGLGLLGRPGGPGHSSSRLHPLVREFLVERLTREIGQAGVVDLHLRVAGHAQQDDWELACHHYIAAGDQSAAQRTIEIALPRIMATGQYITASRYIETFGFNSAGADLRVIRSRAMFSRGETTTAIQLARQAVHENPKSESALANLASLLLSVNRPGESIAVQKQILSAGRDPQLLEIAAVAIALLEASLDGDLLAVARRLQALAARSEERGNRHYEAVSYLNAANVLRAVGDADGALIDSNRALDALEVTFGDEVAGAHAVRGWALAYSGRLSEARTALADARAAAGGNGATLREVLAEFASTEAWLGDEGDAQQLLSEARELPQPTVAPNADAFQLASAQVSLRLGDATAAAAALAELTPRSLSPVLGFETWRLALEAHRAVLASDAAKSNLVANALSHARLQKSRLWQWYGQVIGATLLPSAQFDNVIATIGGQDPTPLSMVAELLADRLSELGESSATIVRVEAIRRPERWRNALRSIVDAPGHSCRVQAARILDLIGTKEDIRRLRSVARGCRTRGADSSLGRSLARRIAPRVFVEDQGLVAIRVGATELRGTEIRRKVLVLLCFLLSRRAFSATRDEVLDALWPDADPAVALNSLNQTIYFLRRVFEPDYRDETTPEYVHHDSEVVWLDSELVDSRSAKCRRMLDATSKSASPSEIAELALEYRGRFALDFAYEDWAAEYRETLHAAYLFAIERAVHADTTSGHFDRGIGIASIALRVDPEAMQLELALLRLYRLSGAHAAAAEQYSHYVTSMREELGTEPPPLDSI